MSDVAIKFENVSKLYELGTVGTGTLSHDLKRWWITSVLHKEDPYLKIGETNDRSTKGDSKFVYALKDIDFEVKQGDVLGIIGKNGAGKSTLLKLLSRVTAPTTGKIYTKGRIASLLEVGTGFHPELTGRENIYMNGTIMGMKKWEIDRKLDEIVDFSGCERYLDTPVKRYSSGMMVRLGFAVAAHLEPEILVVDEVLAVGDAEFQKKAIGKMQDVSKGEGRTVLFVSHNMASIRAICNNGAFLENGMVKTIGSIDDVVLDYISGYDTSIRTKTWRIDETKPISIVGVAVFVDGKSEDQLIDMTDEIKVKVTYYVQDDISNTNLGFSLFKEAMLVFRSWDIDNSPELQFNRKKGFHETTLSLPGLLLPGIYSIRIACGQPNVEPIQVKDDCLQFEISNVVTEGTNKSFTRGGVIKTDIVWDDQLQ